MFLYLADDVISRSFSALADMDPDVGTGLFAAFCKRGILYAFIDKILDLGLPVGR